MNDDLRRQAEVRLRDAETAANASIHELQVHQIELEIQNEELRRTQLELEKSRTRYYDLYNNAPAGYLLLDESATIRRSNQTFMEIVGTEKNPNDTAFPDYLVPEDRGLFLGRFGSFFRDPQGKHMEVTLRTDGTRLVRVQLTGRTEHTGDDRRVMVILTDVTGLKVATDRAEALVKEKELILREVHHRIKNNMEIISAMLSLEGSLARFDETKDALEQARNRINTMMGIYELLYRTENYGSINLKDYIEDLVDRIRKTYIVGNAITITADLPSVIVAGETVVPVGIITTELVVNALKYAFPDGRTGVIRVIVTGSVDTGLCLTIQDDGVGTTERHGAAGRNGTGFGTKLVEALTDQLHGSLEERKSENGFRVSVRFTPKKRR